MDDSSTIREPFYACFLGYRMAGTCFGNSGMASIDTCSIQQRPDPIPHQRAIVFPSAVIEFVRV